MSKKVIVCEGSFRVFGTLSEVSNEVGLSQGEISRALDDGRMVRGLRMRWADRVFAVLIRNVGWRICMKDARDRFVCDGQRVKARDVQEVKELTGLWYYYNKENG